MTKKSAVFFDKKAHFTKIQIPKHDSFETANVNFMLMK